MTVRRTWQQLGREHRRWILISAVIVSAVANALINGALAWITSIGERTVPLWSTPLVGRPSTLTDTLGTLFLLPFFTTLVITLSVRRAQRAEALPPLDPAVLPEGLRRRVPLGVVRRALLFGAVVTLPLAPLAVIIHFGVDFGGVSRATFTIYKVVLGVGLGAVVTPLIALVAMTDPPGAESVDARVKAAAEGPPTTMLLDD